MVCVTTMSRFPESREYCHDHARRSDHDDKKIYDVSSLIQSTTAFARILLPIEVEKCKPGCRLDNFLAPDAHLGQEARKFVALGDTDEALATYMTTKPWKAAWIKWCVEDEEGKCEMCEWFFGSRKDPRHTHFAAQYASDDEKGESSFATEEDDKLFFEVRYPAQQQQTAIGREKGTELADERGGDEGEGEGKIEEAAVEERGGEGEEDVKQGTTELEAEKQEAGAEVGFSD